MKSHKESRVRIDFSAPRLARYMHRAWKRHQDAVFWVDIDLANQRRISVLSDKIERNNGLVPGGQNLSRRQTVFFLPVDPRDKEHKDPEKIDLSVPRLAQYLHSAWKRHQDAVFWVGVDLAIREGLTFYQTRSNAIILQGTLPAHYVSKVERLKTGEMLYERRYLSPRPPPKISQLD